MSAAPLLAVTRTRDGVWTVNERGESRVAVAYFPSKWGAMKHAVRVAMAKPRCRIAVFEPDGVVRVERDYQRAEASKEDPQP